jgi:Family of unknown function (DUF5681)
MTDRHYDVGFKKPPRHTRFKKGQSGNPRGKAKGRKNLKTELLEELGERVVVSENGRHRALPKQTVIVKRMVADAVQGDAKARDQLLRLIGQIDAMEGSRQSSSPAATEDAEIMARFKARLIEEIKAQGGATAADIER